MSELLLMVLTHKVADESAYRSGLPAWFDYIAGNHPHVLHHKVYLDEATGGIVNLQVHPGPESMRRCCSCSWPGLMSELGSLSSTVITSTSLADRRRS